MRVDRWLWQTRFFKTRALAVAAVRGGHVRLDGKRVKPARALRAGDQLKITRPGAEVEITVLHLPARRGPASEAASCYRLDSQLLTAGSPVARRGQDGPPGRPDKHARKALRRLRGR